MDSRLAKNSGQQGIEPVWGCVLIGGKSSRMGKPKHLIKKDGRTWLELIVEKLRSRTENIVISGQGEIPVALQDIQVVEDIEGVQGPLAGIVAILRKYPDVSWIVTGCDMPHMEIRALEWLLAQRFPGVRAILPDINGDGYVEPLLAYYSSACLELLEELLVVQSSRPASLVGKNGIIMPKVPSFLSSSWKNINSPEDLEK